ncbi:MAG: RteC domain-containing protein [Bacteroidota bacterium]|nr:RteC domain-containing protein [Bacteroidota bacterium]
MNKFTQTLYQQLEEELDLYEEMGTIPVNKLNGALSGIREAMFKLKAFILENPFGSENEEIAFFKYEKPKFLSKQVFIRELFAIQMRQPVFGDESLKQFYQAQLADISLFLSRNDFLYEYYRLDLADMDPLLFLRGTRPLAIILPGIQDADPDFSTMGEQLFARFMALESIQAFLIDEIKKLENPYRGGAAEVAGGEGKTLSWTGETINLVELAYGIWLTGQVNHGNASISEIVQWLESHLNVRIGKAHRRWQSISARKRVSQVKYIEEVREAVLKRIDEEYGK